MKKIICCSIVFFTLNSMNAQNTWSKEYSITSRFVEEAFKIVSHEDKLYLQVESECGILKYCSSLMEISKEGLLLNNYYIDLDDCYFDPFNSILLEDDRIINTAEYNLIDTVFIGGISEFNFKNKEFINKQLANKKGRFGLSNIVKWKNDNIYLVVGTYEEYPYDIEYATPGISILDSTLNILKDTVLNKNFYSLVPSDFYQDSDTSFIYFAYGCKEKKCKGGLQIFSYRINKKAEIIDSTYIGRGIYDWGGSSLRVEPTLDGNYVLTWRDSVEVGFNIYETYICKLDKNAKQIWKTNFKVNENVSYGKYMYNLKTLKNGDYLVVGSNELYPKSKNSFTGAWAARINSEGIIQWERNYYNYLPDYSQMEPFLALYDATEVDDGSIYMCGYILDTIPEKPGVQPKLKIWLIKVGPDGCLTPGCNDSLVYISTNEALILKQELLKLTPNHANQNITAIWKDSFTETNHVIIRSIEGSLLKDIQVQGKTGQANIDINNLPSGMYFATIQGNGWQSMPVKFVKQ